MADEMAREVYKALREAQNKYTYFLLAAAGAAIALAVKQTQGTAMAWSQIPACSSGVKLGVELLLWLPSSRLRELHPLCEFGASPSRKRPAP